MSSIEADMTLIRIICIVYYDVSKTKHQTQRFRIYRLNLFSSFEQFHEYIFERILNAIKNYTAVM